LEQPGQIVQRKKSIVTISSVADLRWCKIPTYSKHGMGAPLILLHPSPVPSRRLNIRIRELCARAISADDTNFSQVLSELRSALHEHAAQMREMALQQIAARKRYGLRQPEEEPCKPTPTPISD
jgi:hypothetical protein